MTYYFIENLTELNTKDEVKIFENLVLKVIPINLQYSLKELIKQFSSQRKSPFTINEFPNSFHEFKKIEDLLSGGMAITPRKSDDFRYFVLEEINSTKYNLLYSRAFELAKNDYYIPFAFAYDDKIVSTITSSSELAIMTYYNDLNIVQPYPRKSIELAKKAHPKGFNETDKEEIVNNYELLKHFENIKKDFPSLSKALQDFFLVREISDYSVFKILGYISCLEMLIVDNSYERPKSISLQLQSKLDLLNNQFKNPIKIADYIKVPNTVTLGKMMVTIYDYRSTIAHGNFLDFEKKLQILERVSEQDILEFIREVLKKCLIYSLENPQLIADLKKC